LVFNSDDDFMERGEVPIVRAQPARELPHALDGIEFRTVGWKEDESEIFLTLLSPFLVQFGMMKSGIVENDHSLPMRACGTPPQFLEEFCKGLSIECTLLSTPDKFAIAQSNGSEISNTLPRWRMQKNGVFDLRWNPHPTGCPMLLKMHLVEHPHIDVGIRKKVFQFFLKSFCFSGSP
jgi:hypothetical protein